VIVISQLTYYVISKGNIIYMNNICIIRSLDRGGLLWPGKLDFEAERVRGMTDGDVSHSSEIKLLTCGTGVGLDLFSLWFSFL
jgi:hypothetical protein